MEQTFPLCIEWYPFRIGGSEPPQLIVIRVFDSRPSETQWSTVLVNVNQFELSGRAIASHTQLYKYTGATRTPAPLLGTTYARVRSACEHIFQRVSSLCPHPRPRSPPSAGAAGHTRTSTHTHTTTSTTTNTTSYSFTRSRSGTFISTLY